MKQKEIADSQALQITVYCPRWLQKKMWANLKKAEKNKVNPVQAQKAKALLKIAKAEAQEALEQKAAKSNLKKTASNDVKPAQEASQTERPKVWSYVWVGLGKVTKHISESLKRNRFVRPVYRRA